MISKYYPVSYDSGNSQVIPILMLIELSSCADNTLAVESDIKGPFLFFMFSQRKDEGLYLSMSHQISLLLIICLKIWYSLT